MWGVADVDRLRYRNSIMDDCITPVEYRDVDCSGRSLATLMVAWVGAAMVASVLLRWKYMWIALTILTLLFLFACGYAACNARRAHERAMAGEEAGIFDRGARNRNIQSVSGAVDDCAEVLDPPAYQAYWITDLPPPYAVVIGAESPSIPPPPPMPLPSGSTSSSPTGTHAKPPPYSVAIQADLNGTSQTMNQPSRTIANHVGSSSSGHENASFDESTNSRTEQRVVSVSRLTWDDDVKIASEQTTNEAGLASNGSSTVLANGTHYLTNIISCTFGRGQRRNNDERHGNLRTTTTTTLGDRLPVSQLTNQDNAINASRIIANTM